MCLYLISQHILVGYVWHFQNSWRVLSNSWLNTNTQILTLTTFEFEQSEMVDVWYFKYIYDRDWRPVLGLPCLIDETRDIFSIHSKHMGRTKTNVILSLGAVFKKNSLNFFFFFFPLSCPASWQQNCNLNRQGKARQVYLYSTIQRQGDSKCFTETLKQKK